MSCQIGIDSHFARQVSNRGAGFQAVGNDGKTEKDGKWQTVDGHPTYNIASDGTVDWYTFSGFRRYHSECHTCHGPNGMGSSYAPALKESLKTMSYGDFLSTVASGRKNVSTSQDNVMPAFGDNPNVACHMDDIYVYLRVRANDAIGRVRPSARKYAVQLNPTWLTAAVTP